MKKVIILAMCAAGALAAHAQGQIGFNNITPTPIPIFDVDGTTGLGSGASAELLINGTSVTTTAFSGGGFFQGGDQVVDGIDPGTEVDVIVRAWDMASGATFEDATIRGESDPFTATLGGPNPPNPDIFPGDLSNMESFQLIPEPSTIALAALGAAALIFRRRK